MSVLARMEMEIKRANLTKIDCPENYGDEVMVYKIGIYKNKQVKKPHSKTYVARAEDTLWFLDTVLHRDRTENIFKVGCVMVEKNGQFHKSALYNSWVNLRELSPDEEAYDGKDARKITYTEGSHMESYHLAFEEPHSWYSYTLPLESDIIVNARYLKAIKEIKDEVTNAIVDKLQNGQFKLTYDTLVGGADDSYQAT